VKEKRGPYKPLETEGMTLRQREEWFLNNGAEKGSDPTVPWNFMCAVAPNHNHSRPKRFTDMDWDDRPQEYYHQAGCGRKLPD
jgi:hypothetical protein